MSLLSDALLDLRRGLGLPETAPSRRSVADLDHLARLSVKELGGPDCYRALLPELFAAAATPAAVSALGLEWVKLADRLLAAGVCAWPVDQNEAMVVFFTQLWQGLCTGGIPAWQAHDALYAATLLAPERAEDLLAELNLKGDRLGAPWVQQRDGPPWAHPAEPAVRIWLCDPWRGVELAQEHAGHRGADGSAFRRRLERWRQMVKA